VVAGSRIVDDDGKAIPYGVYDIAQDTGFVSVGIDRDTAQFAVAAIVRHLTCSARPARRRLRVMAPEPPTIVAAAVLATRRGLRRAADRLLPPELALFDLSIGVGTTHALGAFARLRIADALHDGPLTADDLAPRVGADADALHRLLRAAATVGIVTMDASGTVRLTRLGDTLRADHPRSQRDWCLYISSPATTEAWAGLSDAIRTGESSFQAVHGCSVWDHFAQHPDEERVFAQAMRRLTAGSAPALAAAYPWPAGATICDVAGGVGTLLAAVLATDPSLRGVVVEAPGVLTEAGDYIASRGLRGRVDLVAGNMFERIDTAADVYLLKDVLHDWDDERCEAILRVVRAAAPDGARVVLIETPQEPNAPHPFASLVDLQMLTQCDGGRQRSIAELRALLLRCDFTPGTVNETLSHALVEGVAA